MGIAQENLNNYKYIVIPKKFKSFKKPNQYQTSTLLKYAFVQRGFVVVYEDALPEELYKNACLGLTAVLNDTSSMLRIKLLVGLIDCQGKEVFSSSEASNNIKEYAAAYKAAILEAMSSYDNLNYSYNEPKENEKPIIVSFKNDVKTLKEPNSNSSKVTNMPKEVVPTKSKNSNSAVVQIATDSVQSYENIEPITSNIKQASKEIPESRINLDAAEVLYAQPIANGYQLVDGTPKVIIKLLKSSIENVYMANADGKHGMVFKIDNAWVFEYYTGDELVQEKLNIKF